MPDDLQEEEPISKLERAMRCAQRAPGPIWPGNYGAPNYLQERVIRRGNRRPFGKHAPLRLREVIADLLKNGFLETEPPEEEVEEVLEKMIREMEEAEARDRKRQRRAHG